MSELAELSIEPLPSPPTQKGLAMRERLVKAAARAFRLRGYELTRVEDIAKAARTSYGNFYRHFRNKDEVLMAVLRPLLDEVYVASKRRRAPSARLTEDEFAANTIAFLRIYARHRELLRVMREAAARGEKASFYSMWIGERERFVRRTTAWLVRLRTVDAIDADIDPEVAAETLGALTEQLAYVKLGLAEETPSDAEIERLGAHSARIWYRGVFGHQRQASP
jgi:AcrR family transcriptional regulator